MRRTQHPLRRAAAFVLALLLALPLCPAHAWEDVLIAGVGKASTALKVRKAPDRDAGSVDTLRENATVYVLEKVDEEWLKVQTETASGYVLAKYVTGLKDVGGVPMSLLVEPPPIPDGEDPFVAETGEFKENYVAYAIKDSYLYQTPDPEGRRVRRIQTGKELTVSEVSGDWCRVRYREQEGYMLCSALFKWDRLDPYAGAIPGLRIMPRIAFLSKTTEVYSAEDNTILKDYPLPPGSCIAVYEQDLLGRYLTPYNRIMGYVDADCVAGEMAVVPWQDAQPGDLIAAMTTYYAVGVLTEKYRGRNWNIYLATSMISGTVLQPGQSFDMNRTIGPYRRSTGYHQAPILSSEADSGYGGGTCQVNTTFYVTNIQLPILVTHRRVHSDNDVGINYVPRGFDAAVGSGGINLQLTNTLPYAIRYQFFVSDGAMTCCIFRY